jgi:hypothetical protein
VEGVPDDFIHQLKLFPVAELNFAEEIIHRNLKLGVDLMVEILDEQPAVILAFFELKRPRPVDVQKAEDDRSQKNGNQTGKREIFDESKRFCFFFKGLRRHGDSGSAFLKVVSEMGILPAKNK